MSKYTHRVLLIEFPDRNDLDDSPVAFDCRADDESQARRQASEAYPGCKVLEVSAL